MVASLDHDLVGKYLQEQWFPGREQIQERARSLGVDVKGGYSKSLDYLVIGSDVGPGNSKHDSAQLTILQL